MKRKVLVLLSIALLLALSCAQKQEAGKYDAAQRYLSDWMSLRYPGVTQEESGIYILGGRKADPAGKPVAANGYVRVEYTARTLSGIIIESTSEELCRLAGKWSVRSYFGPRIWSLVDVQIPAGVELAVKTMCVGDSLSVLVPCYLNTVSRYNTLAEYKKNAGGIDCIYHIKLLEAIGDVNRWERDSVRRFLSARSGWDTLDTGFWKLRLEDPVSDKSLPADTTVYVNYTGRLLDGKVFDTSVADTAKKYNLWSASKTYEPLPVLMKSKDDWEKIVMKVDGSETSLIKGFSYLMVNMQDKEKAQGLFTSSWGYGVSGSSPSIPSFCPLLFEVEITEKAE